MKISFSPIRFMIFGGLLLVLLLAGCTPAAAPAIPTPVPPTVVLPTAVPPTAVPASATAVPPAATISPTADPHVAGADCTSCHTGEHKRWSTTLHAGDAATVLTNKEHNKAELLTDECITCHAPFQATKFHVSDFVQPVDQKGPWKVVDTNANQLQAIKCEVCHDPTSGSTALKSG